MDANERKGFEEVKSSVSEIVNNYRDNEFSRKNNDQYESDQFFIEAESEKFWTTHVEPLQAENDKLKKFKDYVHNQRDLKSENQKLRDLLKDAHETLIIASLIDKSNTCRDSAARIDAFLKTNP